jgi:hypothetical protein
MNDPQPFSASAVAQDAAFQRYVDSEITQTSPLFIVSISCGGCAFMLCFIWLLKTAKSHGFVLLPALVMLGIALLAGALAIASQPRRSRAARQARQQIWNVYNARWSNCSHGSKLSEEAKIVLNRAAARTLEARSALDSPAWASATGPRAQAREATRISVDEAMYQIVSLAMANPKSPEVGRLIDDLAQVTDELTASRRRLETVAGQAGEGSLGLRAALEQLREISRAEDEVLEHRNS